jgi:hypothetical protein
MSDRMPCDQEKISVSFDVDVYIRHTCPLDCHVSEFDTTIEINESGTVIVLNVADGPLLEMADVATKAVTAMLSDRDVSHTNADARPVADPEGLNAPYPPVRTDTTVNIDGPCPMSFTADKDGGTIRVLNSATLGLFFDDQSLLEFARLVNQAARAVADRRKP